MTLHLSADIHCMQYILSESTGPRKNQNIDFLLYWQTFAGFTEM